MQGRLAAATQVQSAEYLKPLFKTLRSRVRETITNEFHFDTKRAIVITFRHVGSHSRDCPLHAETPIPESE